MTDKDKEILRLFKAGFTLKEIAKKLNSTETAIEAKIKRLRKKGVEVKRWWD